MSLKVFYGVPYHQQNQQREGERFRDWKTKKRRPLKKSFCKMTTYDIMRHNHNGLLSAATDLFCAQADFLVQAVPGFTLRNPSRKLAAGVAGLCNTQYIGFILHLVLKCSKSYYLRLSCLSKAPGPGLPEWRTARCMKRPH